MTPSVSTKRWLGVIVGLQVFTVLAVWGVGPSVSPVQAQGVADAGAQREQTIAELKAVNSRLERLITLLSEGKVQVVLKKPDDVDRKR